MRLKIYFLMISILIATEISGKEFHKSSICLNKALDTKVVSKDSNSLHLSILEPVSNVSIQSVYGIDGVDVYSYNILEKNKNKEYIINLEHDLPDGQGFILINIEFSPLVNPSNSIKREVVSFSVGSLSSKQVEDRRKRIKVYKAGQKEIRGNGSIHTKDIRVHEFPLKKKN